MFDYFQIFLTRTDYFDQEYSVWKLIVQFQNAEVSLCSDHFQIFLTGAEHFDQEYQKQKPDALWG